MPLTDEQAAQLAALEAERNAPPVRTQTGLAGVLHKIVQWAVPESRRDELHDAVEAEVGAGAGGGQAPKSVFGSETEPETSQ